jgi:hypothetical protein
VEIVRGKTFCRLAGGAAIDWLPEAALGWLSAGSRDLAPTIYPFLVLSSPPKYSSFFSFAITDIVSA